METFNGTERVTYISADIEEFNYITSDTNQCTGEPFDEDTVPPPFTNRLQDHTAIFPMHSLPKGGTFYTYIAKSNDWSSSSEGPHVPYPKVQEQKISPEASETQGVYPGELAQYHNNPGKVV